MFRKFQYNQKHYYYFHPTNSLIMVCNSLKGRIVQPPKTGLKCTSAAAPTLQQTVACQSSPLSTTYYMFQLKFKKEHSLPYLVKNSQLRWNLQIL